MALSRDESERTRNSTAVIKLYYTVHLTIQHLSYNWGKIKLTPLFNTWSYQGLSQWQFVQYRKKTSLMIHWVTLYWHRADGSKHCSLNSKRQKRHQKTVNCLFENLGLGQLDPNPWPTVFEADALGSLGSLESLDRLIYWNIILIMPLN